MPNRLRMTILGTLDKLKPSNIKGSSSLKWWSWGPSNECSDLHNLYQRNLGVLPSAQFECATLPLGGGCSIP